MIEWFVSLPIAAMVAIIVVPFLLLGSLLAWLDYKERKRIMTELDLQKGAVYDVITNGGKTHRNITFIGLGHGNRSINGSMNLYFSRSVKYREDTIDRDLTIKYGAVWKVVKVQGAPPDITH
jgi:hypothetical protein